MEKGSGQTQSYWTMGVGQSISELPLEVSVQKEWNLGLGASCILGPPKPAVADLNVNLPD